MCSVDYACTVFHSNSLSMGAKESLTPHTTTHVWTNPLVEGLPSVPIGLTTHQVHIVQVAIINPRRACGARVTVVAVSLCVSAKRHLTSGASVRPEDAATYSTGNKGQKNL